MNTPEKVGILGAGMMGTEIAICFATAGCAVALKDRDLKTAEKGKSRLIGVVDKSVKKGRLAADQSEEVLARILPTADYDAMADADLVIEAVFENMELKKTILAEVDSVVKSECIIATNTSSIPITLLTSAVKESRRPLFGGAHFFAPAFTMKLVEIIPGLETSTKTIDYLTSACQLIGKTPVRVKDTAGFAVNRLLFALFIEAVRLVDEGVASCEDIDTACRLGLGHPLGPFALMDMNDLSMALDVGNLLRENHGERFRFGTALRQRIAAGHLGRKTGQGWYTYDKLG
jgi:3-hydroxybutyryl-CoA dehydrogenase